MKNVSFNKIIFPLFLSFVMLFSCSDDEHGSSSGYGNNEKLNQESFSAGADQYKYTDAEGFQQAATGVEGTGTTSYSSSVESVATVDSEGFVTINKEGVTEITASNTGDDYYNPASDSYRLKVSHPPKQRQSLFSAGPDRDKLITVGSFMQAATGAEGTGATSYTSSVTSTATVNQAGLVTIEGTGITRITAANTGDEDYHPASDSYLLMVTDPDKPYQEDFSAGIDLERHEAEENFIQEAEGVEGTGITVYTSSNATVATVDSSTGFVHVEGPGETIITASNPGDDDFNPARDTYILTIHPSFVTTWKTDNHGASEDKQIAIPVHSSETYNYTVNWGDGNVDTNVAGETVHTYASAGTYTVKIAGDFPGINFNNSGDCSKILSIERWGLIEWKTMKNAFNGCRELIYNAVDAPDLSQVTDMSYMFGNTSIFNGNLSEWDVSNVKDMNHLFYHAISFNGNINGWNVGNVEDMTSIFDGATNFSSDINSWNVGNVEYMDYMFYHARSFNKDLNNWNVSSVKSMTYMFFAAWSFNRDLNNWDVSKVTNMRYMFIYASLFNGNISGWNVGKVSDMGHMFDLATSFNCDISRWDVSDVDDMSYMFLGASAFSGHDLSGWDVSDVNNHNYFSSGWGPGNIEPIWE